MEEPSFLGMRDFNSSSSKVLLYVTRLGEGPKFSKNGSEGVCFVGRVKTGCRGLLIDAAACATAFTSFGRMPPLLPRLWLGLEEDRTLIGNGFFKAGISSFDEF